jgi:hypothetical protein
MAKLRVTKTVAALLATRATYPYVSNTIDNKDGTVSIPVSDDVYNRLLAICSDPDVAILYLLGMGAS